MCFKNCSKHFHIQLLRALYTVVLKFVMYIVGASHKSSMLACYWNHAFCLYSLIGLSVTWVQVNCLVCNLQYAKVWGCYPEVWKCYVWNIVQAAPFIWGIKSSTASVAIFVNWIPFTDPVQFFGAVIVLYHFEKVCMLFMLQYKYLVLRHVYRIFLGLVSRGNG